MPFSIHPQDIIVLVVIGLLLFGPRKLPEIGREVGKMITEFRKGARGLAEGLTEGTSKPVGEPVRQDSMTAYQPAAAAIPTASPVVAAEVLPAQPRLLCSHCGAPNPAAAKFCRKCGAMIAAQQSQPVETAAVQAEPVEAPQPEMANPES